MAKIRQKPHLLEGKRVSDTRGSVSFINTFSFLKVKRFYHIEHPHIRIIRAFHGHMKEEKYVFVTKGTFLVCAVKLTDAKHPSIDETVYRYTLSSNTPQILHIPKGYANGIKALQKQSSIMFFSTATLSQSLNDDYRFPYDYWGKDIWKNK